MVKERIVEKEQGIIGVGDRAVDVELQDEHGAEVRLSRLWQERPVVLAFVRHFG